MHAPVSARHLLLQRCNKPVRRADRLFQIVQFLRGRRLTTARWLAEQLEVSERTVYRDIQDLMASGVPIDGEAGMGYVLHKGFDMPPLMFDRDELQAVVIGLRMVKSWAGDGLERAATRAQTKIDAALPDTLKRQFGRIAMYAPGWEKPFAPATFDQVRHAVDQCLVLQIDYQKVAGQPEAPRCIWPLGLFFWGNKWTLAAWCEQRQAFRTFRLDRIGDIIPQARSFIPSSEQDLTAWLRDQGVHSDVDAP